MSIELLDCTLRDGTYVNKGEFGFNTIKTVVSSLTEANIDIIECGWLNEGAFCQDKTFFSTIEDFTPIFEGEKRAKFSLMLYSDKYNLKKIPQNMGKIDIIREIFHKSNFREAIFRSEIIKEKGYELFYQIVNTPEYNNSELMELAGLANKIKPNCLYIVDTNGSMFQGDLKRVFEILSENLDDDIKIGFHSHNNLQLSFALSMAFIDFAKAKNRNAIIDSTLFGMGRGAGNLNTELIAEYLNKFYFKKYGLGIINKLIQDEILKFKTRCDWGYSIPYLLSGSFNIHSRYAKYLTEKYQIDPNALRDVFEILNRDNKKTFDENKAELAYTKSCK